MPVGSVALSPTGRAGSAENSSAKLPVIAVRPLIFVAGRTARVGTETADFAPRRG